MKFIFLIWLLHIRISWFLQSLWGILYHLQWKNYSLPSWTGF